MIDDIEYKLVLIGDSSVGKAALFKKITTENFKEKNISTIGIDRRNFKVSFELEEKDGTISSKTVQINLLDTAGEERYRSITKTYFRGTDAAIMLYDITNYNSFNSIENWIHSLNSCISLDEYIYTVFLIGTNLDLVESGLKEREVTEEEAIKKCEEFNMVWGGEISIKEYSQEQLKQMFAEFSKIIYKKLGDKQNQNPTVKLKEIKYVKKIRKTKFC